MSKREVQQVIRENEGMSLIRGTLNLNDLLATAHDFIVHYNLKGNPYKYITDTPFRQQIRELFEMKNGGEVPKKDLVGDSYYGLAKLKDNCGMDVWEAVENYFMDIAPAGYYFGSHPGDGSDIGWHPVGLIEEEEA